MSKPSTSTATTTSNGQGMRTGRGSQDVRGLDDGGRRRAAGPVERACQYRLEPDAVRDACGDGDGEHAPGAELGGGGTGHAADTAQPTPNTTLPSTWSRLGLVVPHANGSAVSRARRPRRSREPTRAVATAPAIKR